jgi:membrane protein
VINHPIITVTRDALSSFRARDGDIQAGFIAYSLLLAIFPFLIFCVALTGWLIGDARSAQAVGVLFNFAPEYLAQTLEPALVDVLDQNHKLFTVFVFLSIWAAMSAVEAINRSFDRIYGERPVGVWFARKAKALITVLVSAIGAVVLGLSILLAPTLLRVIEDSTTIAIPTNITLIRYAIGISVFYGLIWSLHWFLPYQHAKGYPRWPGAAFSTVTWVMMATGLSFYLAYSGIYSITYGALAGIVITMLFLYFSGAIIIFGAELNAALQRYNHRHTSWQD